jgi:hypothetical protein
MLMAAISINAQKTEIAKLTGPYLGQKPPGLTPEVFAPGIISTEKFEEQRCVFSSDGRECYFVRRDRIKARILVTKMTPNGWSIPETVSFSNEFNDSFHVLTPDEEKMFFSSRRPLPGSTKENRRGIWFVEREGDDWGEPQYFGRGTQVSISWEGFLYYRDPQCFNEDKILVRYLKDGKYTEPEMLPVGVEGGGRPGHPWIAPDGSYLLFDTFHRDGQGKGKYPDIYVSFRGKDDTWEKGINIGDSINNERHNEICTVSPDGKYLFYEEGGDIYWVDAKIIQDLKPKKFE